MKKIVCIVFVAFIFTLSSCSKDYNESMGLIMSTLADRFYHPSIDRLARQPQIDITLRDLEIKNKKVTQLYKLILRDAKSKKTVTQIKKLQAAGVDINAKLPLKAHYRFGALACTGELTPLSWAVIQRKKHSMEALLEAGADPNERFKWALVDEAGEVTQEREASVFINLNDYSTDPEYLTIALRYGLNPDDLGQASSGDYLFAIWKNKLLYDANNASTEYSMFSQWPNMKAQYLIDAGLVLSNRTMFDQAHNVTNTYALLDVLAVALNTGRYDAAWYLICNGASIHTISNNVNFQIKVNDIFKNAKLLDRASPQWQFAKKIVRYYRANGFPNTFLSVDTPIDEAIGSKEKDDEGDYYAVYKYAVEIKFPKFEDEYWYPYQAQSPSAMALERAKLSEAYYLQKLTTPTPMDDLWRARYYLKIKQYSLVLQMLEQSQTKPITSPQAQGYIKDALNELLASGYTAVLSDKLKALLAQR